MTYNTLVLANIKKSFRKYLSYYLSGSFCIAIFYIFVTLIFNESIKTATTNYPLVTYFIVSIISILLFSCFFISYTHYTFVKNRHKEFGVYMISGMSSRDLNKMLFTEMLVLLGLSMVTGLVVGSIFANLIQLIVTNLLDIEASVSITFESYLITIATFILLYGSIFLVSLFKINKMDIASLMKENQKKESQNVRTIDYVFAVTGLVCTIVSIVMVLANAKNNSVNTTPLFMISYLSTTLIGLLFTANYGLEVILGLTHKTKLFNKRLLSITQMEQKFGQNHRIILVLSVMASLIILSIGAPTALVSLTDDIVREGGLDLEYRIDDESTYDDASIDNILSGSIKEKNSYSYIYGTINNNKIIIFSQAEYNLLNNCNIALNDNECMNVITSWEPGDHGIAVNSYMDLLVGDCSKSYLVKSSEKGFFFANNLSYNDSVVCVSDTEYLRLKAIENVGHGVVNKVTYSVNYQTTKDIDKSIRSIVPLGSVYTRYANFVDLKGGYSTFLFVSLTQSIMFFISTGFVLFFKQMNELNDNKKEFNKLYKIGITDKEMTRVISSQLRIVYFTPIILGAIFGFSIMYYMTNLFVVSSDTNRFISEFMKYGSFAALAYFGVQVALYFYTKVMYKHNVLYK